MNGEQIHDAMNYLDQDLIEQVDVLRRRGHVRRSVTRALIPAACVGVVLLGALVLVPGIKSADTAENGGAAAPESMEDAQSGYMAGNTPTEPSAAMGAVTCEHGFANMTVNIPAGWEYELREYDADSQSFGIAFWPEGYSGKVSVSFYPVFGVCGTGLAQEEITLAGEMAWMGTYDGHALWDFICFAWLPGDYVVMNEGAEEWWGRYGGEAMEILNTMELANGIMTRDRAIELAREQFDGQYDEIGTRFDAETGCWYVELRLDGINAFGVVILPEQ